jgi:hypothetical protein
MLFPRNELCVPYYFEIACTIYLIDIMLYFTAYNVANAIFAGTAPLLQTSLVLHARTPYVRNTSFFIFLVVEGFYL